ncbi:MAG: HAD family phosphatase [Myxococcales bacterium]|nr:HAD family phosphatase [Myxococcales bacterium]
MTNAKRVATIFDFNGVLVDDEELHREGFNYALSTHDIEIDRQAYEERYLGFDDRGAFEAILADFGQSSSRLIVDGLIAVKARYYESRARSGALKIFDEAPEVLALAAAQGPVGIVSGALRAEIYLALELMGASKSVEFVCAAEDVEQCKPDPAGYLQAIDWLFYQHRDVALSDVVVIEDSLAGIAAAKAAKLPVWAVAHSYERAVLERTNPDRLFATLADLHVALRER